MGVIEEVRVGKNEKEVDHILKFQEPRSFDWDLVNDLSALPENENAVVKYLFRRLEQERIYTWVGPLLLALNPGKVIHENAHDKIDLEEYKNVSECRRKEAAPHIREIALRAHYRLVQNVGKSCQVIVISGESGAGKTFNANKALDFLASSGTKCTFVRDIVRKITSACPLISAFNTATTEKNRESSRSSRMVKLDYENGNISGASIHSFLLERSRVTTSSNNFHIFSQLIAGLPDLELQRLKLSREKRYRLIGNRQKLLDSDFRRNFGETVNAMKDLGFSSCERKDLFQVIAMLIHLGNITFKEKVRGGCTVDLNNEESKEALLNGSVLAGLNATELAELLTTSRIAKRRDSVFRCELSSVEMCRKRLHSIMRHIYYQLFQQLIDRVNESLSSNAERKSWLGILDVFGFEVFAENGIEQLCINYANERLQLYFMEDYLDSGRSDLAEEGLDVFSGSGQTHVYKERLAVIENSLFPALSDATQCLAQFNVAALRTRLLNKSTRRFLEMPQENPTFVIRHYSSAVEYSFANFVSKNSDKVPPELSIVFAGSKNMFLDGLKKTFEDDSDANGKIYAKKNTTLAKLKQNLDELIKELRKCDSHYVRCIRPSRANGVLMENEFKKQLSCTGIFDALRLARCKYPIRMPCQDFRDRYSFKRIVVDTENSALLCKSIALRILGPKKVLETMHFGSRLVFCSESTFFKLEDFRKKCRSNCARRIQNFWKNSRKNCRKESPEDNKNKTICLLKEPPEFSENSSVSKVHTENEIEKLKKTEKKSPLKIAKKWLKKICRRENDTCRLIFFEGCVFNYKNGVLSRQRIAEVPVRFHTRLTCLKNSHILPKSELPRGLPDCL